MNNTFAFNRFKNLLLKDGKMYIRNFGSTLIAFCCMTAIIWIFSLLFSKSAEGASRLVVIVASVVFAMMIAPSKVYGNANLSREGVGFAMLPASSLEKFISMFIYCAIVTPVIVFFGGFLVDTLLSLFPFGGFEKSIHLYSINEIARMMNDHSGVAQLGEATVNFTDVFSIGAMRTSLYLSIIQWAAIFMLGNMLFKKHKAGKTFACYLGIGYVLSTIMGVIMVSNGRMQQWMNRISDYSTEEMIHFIHNATIWGMVIGIIVTVLLLFFTYRKIKTQKY